MIDAAQIVGEGLVLAFWQVVPAVAAAVAASVIVGALGARVGLRDPQVTALARAIAVIVTVVLLGDAVAGEVVRFGSELWQGVLVEASG